MITADSLVGRFAPDFDVERYVEKVCVQHLEDELIRSWLSPEALLDWTTTGARLLVCTPEALTVLMSPEGNGNDGRRPRGRPGRRERDERAAQFALLGSAALVLAVLGETPAGLGWNVFTAELALGGLGALGFALTCRNAT